MAEAYIVDAVRTPMGKRGGGLSQVHPVDLSAHVMRALVERTGVDPGAVDDVIWGCEVDAEQRGGAPRTSSAARRMVPSPPSTMTSSSSSASTSSPSMPRSRRVRGRSQQVVAFGRRGAPG